MIKFENVTKRYGDKLAVDDVSFNIEEGETFVLIGPSGCGKTTTLKMINRLISLSNGYIYFKNNPISEYPIYEMRWDIGYVLQQIALFPHMTIKENIAQVPQMKKWSAKDIDARIDELMDMVGLEPKQFKDRLPAELSGGQQQRVGVVRALAADPPVILMDEPFSALDPISREKLQDDLVDLQKKIKKTIVFVTHDIQEALKLGDRICLLREGRVEQIGTPDEFMSRPDNDFVREFIGDLNNYRIQQVALEEVVKEISPLEDDENLDVPELSGNASLHDAFTHLAESDSVIVVTAQGKKKIRPQDVFRYMSSSKEENR